MAQDQRIVLRKDVPRDEVAALGARLDWELLHIGRPGDDPLRDVWETLSGDATITYLEDQFVQLRYLVVQGPAAQNAAEVIRESLPAWSFQNALELLESARNRDEKVHAIYLVCVSAGSENLETAVGALRKMARDPEVDVRHAVLVGIGYLGAWPPLRALAEELQRSDPEETVRRDAGFLLEAMDRPDLQ